MRRVLLLVILALLVAACSGGEPEKPLSEAGEKLYVVRGKILSRDAGRNVVNMDHEAIPGFMEAMVMDYAVRGVKVETLPADGKRVEAKLHVTERAYWITDVRPIP
ncbi:MAG TPA: copper-binding protein [Thermoanaerobaculia bacterium]|jgi:protein SCO1/2